MCFLIPIFFRDTTIKLIRTHAICFLLETMLLTREPRTFVTITPNPTRVGYKIGDNNRERVVKRAFCEETPNRRFRFLGKKFACG